MGDKAAELAEAVKDLIRDNLTKKGEKALRARDNYQSYKEAAGNAGLEYLYEMKINQLIGYIDALDDILEELE